MKEQHSVEQATAAEGPAVSRRALTAGAIWSLPVIATIGAAPAMAASTQSGFAGVATVNATDKASWGTSTSNARFANDGVNATLTTTGGNASGSLNLSSFGLVGTLATGETLAIRIYNRVTAGTMTVTVNGNATVPATSIATGNVDLTFTAPNNIALSTLTVRVAFSGVGNNTSIGFDAVRVTHTH